MSKELLKKLEDFQGSEIKKMDKIVGGTRREEDAPSDGCSCVTCTPNGNRTGDAD